MKLIKKLKTASKYYLVAFAALFAWGLLLLAKKSHWTEIALLIVGSIIGHLLKEINWAFLSNKDLAKIIPIILIPLTLFILTSTTGPFGKAIIVFFNLRLILDKRAKRKDNERTL